ncbi:hypothetical protein [Plantactinospora sp. KBS50]|uniref:hypothetical protein n=1 Tax=Plantactinospora sp. KBS50 TaxID=2024580 RepID=UPI0012FD10A2|nr:hypothetical protein [Plantactinospora sp. KBS50]
MLLAFRAAAVSDDAGDIGAEGAELVSGDGLGQVVEADLQAVAPSAELGEIVGELRDAGFQQGSVNLAVFVVSEVPVDDRFLLRELGFDLDSSEGFDPRWSGSA